MSSKHFHRSVSVIALALAAIFSAGAVLALPQDRILVVEASLIEGLAEYQGEVVETETTVFDAEAGAYRFDAGALPELDGLRVLFLVERRRDIQRADRLERRRWQEVLPMRDDFFELSVLPDVPFWYQLAEVDGEVGLLGQGNLLRSEGGEGEPFQVWRIDALRTISAGELGVR